MADSPYAPLRMFEYDNDPGTFCLMLSGDDMAPVFDVFEECGYEGGGYGWEGLARSLVKPRGDQLDYDSEASMFVAYGTDDAALRQLAKLLHQAYHDRGLLARQLRAADPELFDD